MIYVQLPLFADAEMYRYSTTIEQDAKQLTFRWNSRMRCWHMDIHNEDQTEVVTGVALVSQYPILVDHPMKEAGINGYFVVLPINEARTEVIGDDPAALAEFFQLFYCYQE